MSDRAKAFAWETGLPPTERFILLALADHADQDGGHIDTGLPSIAAKTGYAHRTVQRTVGKLLERGVLILVDAQPGIPSMYQIDITWRAEGVTHDHPCQDVTRDTRSPVTHDHPCQTITRDTVSSPPSERMPTPQTRRPSRARVLTSSSEGINAVKSSKEEGGGGPHKADVVAGLIALGLDSGQSRKALAANPRLSLADVAAWRDWLEAVDDPNPMPIMVARLKRGDPVPRIWGTRAPTTAPPPIAPVSTERRVGRLVAAPSMVIPISPEELEENRRIMARYGIVEEVRHVSHLTR